MKRRRPAAIWGATSLITLAVLALFQPTTAGIYDEAIMILGAMQVQDGSFPGTGFYSVYGPLQYMVSATLLTLWEGNILSLRLYHVFSVAVTVLCLASVVSTTPTATNRAVVALFVLCGVIGFTELAFPLYPTHMLALFGAVFAFGMVHFGQARGARAIIALGVFNLLLVLLDPLRGAVIIAMQFIALPFQRLNMEDLSWSSTGQALVRLVLACGLCAVGVLAHEIATGGALLATVQFLLSDQIPAYTTHRALPLPTFSTNTSTLVPFYLPAITLVTGGICYLFALMRPDLVSQAVRLRMFWLLFFCAALYPSGFVRTHAAQLWPTLLFALAFIFLMLGVLLTRVRARPYVLTGLFALLCVVFAFDQAQRDDSFATDCALQDLAHSPMSCLRVGPPAAWAARQDHMETLDQFLAPDERIFVTTMRHDQIYVADLSPYVLLGRLPFTRWAHLEPGIHTTQTVQTDIIGEITAQIAANGRAIVILQPAQLSSEPNLSAVSSGVRLLDDYLATCAPAMVLGTLEVRSCTQAAPQG